MARKRTARTLLAALCTAGLAAGCSSRSGGSGASGGSPTAQQAVSALLTDLSAHRYSVAVGDLVPGERAALQEPLPRLIAQLDRLDILKAGTTLDNFSGLSFSFANPTYQVSTLATGVDFVHFTGGTVTASARPADLPLGSTLRSLVGPGPRPVTRTRPLAGPNAGLVAVNDGGRWYVSLGYSVGELGRRSAGLPVPAPSSAIVPAGDASPDAAVSDFFRSSLSENVSHLVALGPPDELAAAEAYTSLYVGKAEAAAGTRRFHATLDSVKYDDISRADGTLVVVRSISMSGQVSGTPFSFKDGCLTASGITICRNHLGELLSAGHAPAAAARLATLIAGLRPQIGIMTVKENGKWYVSPTRTLIDDTTAILAAISPAQLHQAISDVMALRNRG